MTEAPDFEARLASFQSDLYRELRAPQRDTLAQFAQANLTTPNLGIELPTGVGKTLVALLIADWSLDNGWSVAYLTGTRQLADQVHAQALHLPGLSTHRFWGDHYPGAALDDYHQAQAVGIMNYWVYFNSSPRVEPADVVIFDDAHLAEQPLTGMFGIRIEARAHPDLFTSICDLVLAHSDAYGTLQAIREGTAPFQTPPELLAFNDWHAVANAVASTVDADAFAGSDEGRFVWPDVRSRLSQCGVLIGPTAIEIRPYYPASRTLASATRPRQRVFFSATLGTMADLERRLGIGPIRQLGAFQQADEATGRRLLILNPETDSYLGDGFSSWVLDLASQVGRTAWLCASHFEADQVQGWLGRLGRTAYRLRRGDDSALDQWRQSTGGHLVSAGRFDGLDFAGDVCRLVVIPSVPAASSEFERFAVAYLGDAAFMRHRIGQRVTQALGRANRTDDDWAIYVGLDSGFATALAQSSVRNVMSPDVSAVVRRALELHEDGTGATRSAAYEFLEGRDPSPRLAGRRRPGREAPTISEGAATQEVGAATALWLGDFGAAVGMARSASDALVAADEPEHGAFWSYVEAHAEFLRGNPGESAAAIDRAVVGGPRTAWFIRLGRTLGDLRGLAAEQASPDDLFLHWDAWIREMGGRTDSAINQARVQLRGTHDQRAEGLVVLARLSGAWASRPGGNSAADGRWVWNSQRFTERRVWEIKTGLASAAVSRAEINQVLGQIRVEELENPRTRVYGCLWTPHATIEADAAAAARETVAVLSAAAVEVLFDLMADRFRQYSGSWGSGTAQERGDARAGVESRLPSRGWLNRLLAPSGGTVMGEDFVRGLFP